LIRRGDGYASEGELRLQTRADGGFSANVPSGHYWALVTSHNPERVRDFPIEAADEISTVLILPDVTTLVGTLSGFPGEVAVQIIAKDAPPRGIFVSNGDFTVPNVPRGELLLGVIAGSAIAIETVRVEPPALATVHLAPRPVARVKAQATLHGLGPPCDAPN